MRNGHGLTALEMSNPNREIGQWLRALATRNVISRDTLREADRHFKLRPGLVEWQIFLTRIFALTGVLLMVAGLVFFMAWNWEDMGRFAKFAILEFFFAGLSAYAVTRWNGGSPGFTGWGARVALIGVALLAGGMLALYGQTYQTGADAWELFRAWTLVLLLIALAGRSTAFWFLTWLVGSLWAGLYLTQAFSYPLEWTEQTLILGLLQFLLLAANETASFFLKRKGIIHDGERWLSRIIGCSAIVIMAVYGIFTAAVSIFDDPYDPHALMNTFGPLLYLFSLATTFVTYTRLIREFVLVALSAFSLATCLGTAVVCLFVRSGVNDFTIFLPISLVILGCVFGALKLVLYLRKTMKERELPQETAGKEIAERGFSGVQSPVTARDKKGELASWLIARGEAAPEDLADFFNRYERERDEKEPWYARVFVTLGVWLGSAALLAFFSLVVFEAVWSPLLIGLLGLALCFVSIQTGVSGTLAKRALSQVLGICGLIYSGFLLDFDLESPLLLLSVLFGVFWLLRPPCAGRTAAFLGMATCAFWFLGSLDDYGSFAPLHYSAPILAKTGLCCVGLLWATHYLVVMDGQAPHLSIGSEAWLKERFEPGEVLHASAYGSLIFFAGMAMLAQYGLPVAWVVFPDFNLAVTVTMALLTLLFSWRYPASRRLALPIGLILTLAAWFAPVLALGMALLFLAFYNGQPAFLAVSTFYLGLGNYLYYYSLSMNLFHKSLLLLAVGLCLLFFSLALHIVSKRTEVGSAM